MWSDVIISKMTSFPFLFNIYTSAVVRMVNLIFFFLHVFNVRQGDKMNTDKNLSPSQKSVVNELV